MRTTHVLCVLSPTLTLASRGINAPFSLQGPMREDAPQFLGSAFSTVGWPYSFPDDFPQRLSRFKERPGFPGLSWLAVSEPIR